ncbi:hypothetical protein [Rhodopseudomonas palustris]|uniref:hypothetical protein n=1 Tax=Rhodopseudomonas palustris TaxID=1076 RepID=UPI000641DFD3|nr:hypothetical protein [Rhodopseudomonas palustris]
MVKVIGDYVWNLLLAIDQLGNALAGGWHDETISSRVGKSILAGGWASKVWWPRWLRDHWLDSVEPDEGWPS